MNYTEYDNRPKIRSSWNQTRMLIRGPLTDRQIEKYRKAGWYSEAFRNMRREKMKKTNLMGNFIRVDDRMIYSPKP